MGVDYFPCTICNESVCDCGPYVNCEVCGSSFCIDCFPKKITWKDFPVDDPKRYNKYEAAVAAVCPICNLTFIPDSTLLDFLLAHFDLTKEEAEQMYRKADK